MRQIGSATRLFPPVAHACSCSPFAVLFYHTILGFIIPEAGTEGSIRDTIDNAVFIRWDANSLTSTHHGDYRMALHYRRSTGSSTRQRCPVETIGSFRAIEADRSCLARGYVGMGAGRLHQGTVSPASCYSSSSGNPTSRLGEHSFNYPKNCSRT